MFLKRSLGIVVSVLLSAGVRAQMLDEYQVKAAFLYNFAKFVEWPPQAFQRPGEPIAVCVVGQDRFEGALEETVKGKEAEGRPLVVRNVTVAKGFAGCQILFVSASERKHFPGILSSAKQCGLLTVGEAEGFASAGGMINFKREGGRVRFEINVEAAQQRELRISSKLLMLAETVKK